MAFRLTDFLSAAEKTMLCLLCFFYDSCCFKAAKCPPELFRKNPPVSIRRGSARRGSVRRGSVRRGSVRRGSVRRKKALRGKAAGQTGLNRPFFQREKPKTLFLPSLPEKGSGGGIKQENAVGVVLQDGSRTHGGDFALYGIFNSLRF